MRKQKELFFRKHSIEDWSTAPSAIKMVFESKHMLIFRFYLQPTLVDIKVSAFPVRI